MKSDPPTSLAARFDRGDTCSAVTILVEADQTAALAINVMVRAIPGMAEIVGNLKVRGTIVRFLLLERNTNRRRWCI